LINLNKYFFSEDQSRYIIEVEEVNTKQIFEIFKKNSIFCDKIGIIQKEYLTLDGEFKISVEELKKLNNSWFIKYTN